jgi:hypothetical protein
MKEVEKKEVPDVSGGVYLPDTIGLPYPPFPDPDYPQVPGGSTGPTVPGPDVIGPFHPTKPIVFDQ